MKKIIKTGLSPEYVKGWDIEKAIREIVQNWIDSRKEFNCGGTIVWKDGTAKVKDNGPGLEMRHFAIGISEKNSDSIGHFGEGLKLALLVMAREKRDIAVWTKGQIIHSVIEFDEDYQTETMKLVITDMLPRHAAKFKGCSIKFSCTKEELEAGKSYFMAFQIKEKSAAIQWMERGRISTPGGKVYINGAAVGSIPDSLFSYHIDGADGQAIGNRDRSSISEKDLNPIIMQYLSYTPSLKVMRMILSRIEAGAPCWETRLGIDRYLVPNKHKKTWKKAINHVFGEKTVLSGTQQSNTQAAYRGFRIFEADWHWKSILSLLGMRKADELKVAAKKSIPLLKISDLSFEEQVNFKEAMRLIAEHYFKVERIDIAEDLVGISGMAKGSDAIGLCARKGGKFRIYIKRSILTSLGQAVHTILHEQVHGVSGTNDLTPEYEHALLGVAIKMMHI